MPTVTKWDCRFLALARHVAQWSKDPSTQTGAVIVDPKRRVVSVGYNGLPMGVVDSPDRLEDRPTKYRTIVHAERNALLFARGSVDGCTLYVWPFGPCTPCASMVIQAGIVRCVAPVTPERLRERWEDDLRLTSEMFWESGVRLDLAEEIVE